MYIAHLVRYVHIYNFYINTIHFFLVRANDEFRWMFSLRESSTKNSFDDQPKYAEYYFDNIICIFVPSFRSSTNNISYSLSPCAYIRAKFSGMVNFLMKKINSQLVDNTTTVHYNSSIQRHIIYFFSVCLFVKSNL